jgi:hypothetical protein
MINAVFSEERGDRLERLFFIFTTLISSEIHQLFAGLALDKREPVLEGLKNSRGSFVGDNVNPSISGSFIDDDEIHTNCELVNRSC